MDGQKDTRRAGTVVERVRSQGVARSQRSSVTVISSWSLHPNHEPTWRAIWERLGRLAVASPACRSFRLSPHTEGRTEHTALSEWQSIQHFHAFIRSSGILWLERSMGFRLLPHTIDVRSQRELEADSAETGKRRHLVLAG